jgi:glyoxylase-like metal-dependent hydrolase (beta-lactamase superfamily II)
MQTVELRRDLLHGDHDVSGDVFGVTRIGVLFANVYALETPDGGWVLLDTGLEGFSRRLRRSIEHCRGRGAGPKAILLTHGHHDHAGNARALAAFWGVPVYAHRLELPFLTGQSLYPPEDRSVGGAPAWLARIVSSVGYDLTGHVRPLPDGGEVPFLPDWHWLHTPGHSPGHIVLFRESDRTLLSGDAVVTMNLDSWLNQLTRRRRFGRPPASSTPDWETARQSVRALAELAPHTVAAGHGLPMSGPPIADELRAFAETMTFPRRGRYVDRPAVFHPDGSVASLPAPVPDPITWRALIVAAGLLLALALAGLLSGCLP